MAVFFFSSGGPALFFFFWRGLPPPFRGFSLAGGVFSPFFPFFGRPLCRCFSCARFWGFSLRQGFLRWCGWSIRLGPHLFFFFSPFFLRIFFFAVADRTAHPPFSPSARFRFFPHEVRFLLFFFGDLLRGLANAAGALFFSPGQGRSLLLQCFFLCASYYSLLRCFFPESFFLVGEFFPFFSGYPRTIDSPLIPLFLS